MWTARLRWRLRGAWLWPLFIALTFLGGVSLEFLPLAGDGPAGIVPATILAGFFNLGAVLLAYLAVPLMRRRRPDLPVQIAHNYAGTAAICAVFAMILTIGLIHRPQRAGEQRDRVAATLAVRDAVLSRADLGEFHAGAAAPTSLRLQEDLYRVCADGPTTRRSFCMYVQTDQSPPGVEEDQSREPNAMFNRPGGFK